MSALHPSTAGINSSGIKQHNIGAILQHLLHKKTVSRVALANWMGVSTATITNLVTELVAQGLIVEEGVIRHNGQASVGRPQMALRLVPDARYVAGVHIDVGRMLITLCNLCGEVVGKQVFEHQLQTPWQQVMDETVDVVETLIGRSGINRAQILGAGVAASGLVDSQTGVNIFAPNLNWRQVPIGAYLRDRLNLPVHVENNVRAMALGEALLGRANEATVMAFIYARVGVGAGFIVDGQIFRGGAAGAGEIGHTVLALEQARQGDARTLESLFSEPALIAGAAELIAQHPSGCLARRASQGKLTLDAIFEVAQAGDRATLDLLIERAEYFGIALANLVNVFNPELIVLGGIFTREHNLILPTVLKTLKTRAFANLGDQISVQVTEFGQDAGMIGAAALALDRFFYRAALHMPI